MCETPMRGMTVTEDIVSGATMHEITHGQLGAMTHEAIDAIDCTIVVCMINAKEGQQQLAFTEMSGIGVHVIELCRKLLRHKRGGIILGGSADLWSFDPRGM